MIRSAYSARERVSIVCGGGRTKQSMKDECDINRIMRKYIKSGTVSHVAKHGGRYEYCTASDFMESLSIVQEGQRMFDELPAVVRKEFGNSPASFLSFVQDPKNLDKMREMGLARAAPPVVAPAGPAIAPAPPSTPPT